MTGQDSVPVYTDSTACFTVSHIVCALKEIFCFICGKKSEAHAVMNVDIKHVKMTLHCFDCSKPMVQSYMLSFYFSKSNVKILSHVSHLVLVNPILCS